MFLWEYSRLFMKVTESVRQTILNYKETQSRNKIVFHKDLLDGIDSLNAGYVLSSELKKIIDDKRVSLKGKTIIERILRSSIVIHPDYGNILALDNIGILLEPELKLDFISFLEEYSKDNILFIRWSGHIENDLLWFLSKDHGMKISIENLSYIII